MVKLGLMHERNRELRSGEPRTTRKRTNGWHSLKEARAKVTVALYIASSTVVPTIGVAGATGHN